jgi:aminoglycoside 3-N-acetyltransferase
VTADAGTSPSVRGGVARDCAALGVRRGGVLLVHASVKALGPLGPGGAEDVVLGLLDALGPEGTLLMPGLSYISVGPSHPHFDALTTPVCVGALPEFFRRRPGTLRSTHPTHSVCAAGRDAADFVALHHLDSTPVGPRSPFAMLPVAGGQILMLGCGLCPNTSMHGVEELSEPPYLFGVTTHYFCADMRGVRHVMEMRNHGFAGYDQRYDRVAGILADGELRAGRVLAADCHLIEARALWDKAHDALEADPLRFVEQRRQG